MTKCGRSYNERPLVCGQEGFLPRLLPWFTSLNLYHIELDMMRFPISFLTAAALVEGIIVALLDEYQQDNKTATSSRSSSTNTSLDDVDLEKVNRDVVPICGDVTKLLGMTMVCVLVLILWRRQR